MHRLCELVVKTEGDVLTLIEQGGAVRKVASTNMNERSSRSHSCFTIKVSGTAETHYGGFSSLIASHVSDART